MTIHAASRRRDPLIFVAFLCATCMFASCGNSGSEAQRHGVGAACAVDGDCLEMGQTCLAFKGGYCGIPDCTANSACPAGSACVAHSDGRNYCFLVCVEKGECNRSRGVDVEANCSSNITFTDANVTRKACVPPSG